MLKPHKYLDLDNSVLLISSEMLKVLTEYNCIEYEDLFRIIKEKFEESGDFLFLPALNFLYLLGVVEYSSELDMLELIK